MTDSVIAEPTAVKTGNSVFGTAAPPRTLLDVFQATAEAYPGAPALDDGTTTLDYRALAGRVERVARHIRARGIGPGDRVGLRVPSGRADLYVGVLAVLAAGAAYVPVDFDEPEERAQLVFSEAGVCAVLGEGLALKPTPAIARPASRACGRDRVEPADDAWIIFTSGSSGTPKGVAVSHRAAAAFVDAEASLFVRDRPLGPGDRVFAGLSIGFDASCEEMWLAWRHGACLVPAPRAVVRSGPDLGPWLAERGITVVSTVPTLAALWPPELLRGVRLLIFGGEACPAELVDRFDDGTREVWNTYGPTEATVVSTAARLRAGEPVRIGRPLPGWRIAVVDAGGAPVTPGAIGELMIGGVGLARYLDAEKDRHAYPPMPQLGWTRGYRSGDLVRAEPEGLVFVGRADDQVKIGGRRIELGEVETALLDLPGVSAAAAVVRNGAMLVGYLLLEDSTEPFDAEAAQARLARRLPHGLVPTLAVLPEFPLNAAGKVDRRALPWPLPATTGTATRFTGDTAWIAERWQDLLGAAPAPEEDFFAAGGTSVTAARLISMLRQRFPRASVADLYQHRTFGAFAATLTAASVARPDTEQHPAPRPPSRLAGAAQTVLFLLTLWVTGARWTLTVLLSVAVFDTLIGDAPVSAARWIFLGAGVALLQSSPGRALIAGLGARLLTAGVQAGEYRRGGWTHLRLSAAERLVTAVGVAGLPGTPWNVWYARLLGNDVGADIDLHALPPVSGLGRFGDRCAVEPETDLAGWWLDGDTLRVGRVDVGADASVGGRSTLLPGAVVGAAAVVAPGTSVRGEVPGSDTPRSPARRAARWRLAYALAPLVSGSIVLLSILPAATAFVMLDGAGAGVAGTFWLVPLLGLVTLVLNAALTALVIRLAGRWLRPGEHPVHSRAGWAAWLVQRATTSVRETAFPLYASLATTGWLRLLGASVGTRTEVSTVVGIPQMMTVGAGSFLADDTVVAPYRLRAGRLRIGPATVADGAFVGNSAEVPPGHDVPAGSLIGVLSAAPASAPAGTSWLGRPALEIPRRPDTTDPSRTHTPPRRLVALRALVELTRVVPLALNAILGFAVYVLIAAIARDLGAAAALATAGVIQFAAALAGTLVAVAAKWLLIGRVRRAEHPLWSGFVWRNELVAVYHEELAMRWLGPGVLGTPVFSAVLRAYGAKVGRGVHCETKWLPEPDLVSLGDGAVVNRGCVVQTHLFQDRILRLGTVRLAESTTLGPHSITLFDTALGSGCSIGANSLVMRGETLPARHRFAGNPVAALT